MRMVVKCAHLSQVTLPNSPTTPNRSKPLNRLWPKLWLGVAVFGPTWPYVAGFPKINTRKSLNW